MSVQGIESFFSEDHERLIGFFSEYQKLKEIDFSKAKECFRSFLSALRQHVQWEEGLLFPLFEEKTALRDIDPTISLRQEHREVEKITGEIHKKIRNKDGTSDKEEVRLLIFLNAHHKKEEDVIFPLLDELTDFTERKEIFEKIQSSPQDRHCRCCCNLELK